MKRELLIVRDGKATTSYLTQPLRDGEQGNMQTLLAMKQIVNEDRVMPDLRAFVMREIVGDIAGHDARGEVEAIFEFARDRITYRKDPWGVEIVSDMWSTLYALDPKQPVGDCGVKSLFIATACAILGHKPFFIVARQFENQPTFNHVFNGVIVNGKFIYLDATPEDKPAGWAPDAYELKMLPIF